MKKKVLKITITEDYPPLQVMTFEFPDMQFDVILDANPKIMAARLINLGRTIESNSLQYKGVGVSFDEASSGKVCLAKFDPELARSVGKEMGELRYRRTGKDAFMMDGIDPLDRGES